MATGGTVEVFIGMLEAWEAVVPEALLGLNPRIVLTILRLSSEPGGISQSQLQRQLGMNQSYLSKLMHRLEVTAHWIEIKSPPNGGRRCLSSTTGLGKEALASLEIKLRALTARAPSPRRTSPHGHGRRRTIRKQAGQLSFF